MTEFFEGLSTCVSLVSIPTLDLHDNRFAKAERATMVQAVWWSFEILK